MFYFFDDILTVLFIILLSLVNIFMNIALPLLSGKLLIFISLQFFSLRFHFILSFETYCLFILLEFHYLYEIR